jgi:adenosylmethionine---8-amino-7-oxononanoate aminotransferase
MRGRGRQLALLRSAEWCEQVARIERLLHERLAPATELAGVRSVRVFGAIGVVQFDRPVDIASDGRLARRGRLAAPLQ